MKITNAPGEIDVDAMLDIFHAVIRDVPELPFDDIHYVRTTSDGFSHFVDPEIQSLWIGFALGHRARDRLVKIPEQRPVYGSPDVSCTWGNAIAPPEGEGPPPLFCIGEYLASLADTLDVPVLVLSRQAAGLDGGQALEVLEAALDEPVGPPCSWPDGRRGDDHGAGRGLDVDRGAVKAVPGALAVVPIPEMDPAILPRARHLDRRVAAAGNHVVNDIGGIAVHHHDARGRAG